MLMGIFVESNEDLGLMWHGYKDIPGIVTGFLSFVHKTVDYALKEGIPEDDMESKLKTFKQECRTSIIKPVNVNTKKMKEIIDKIKATDTEIRKCLEDLGTVRKKFRFGDNIIQGIIIKPKLYTNSIDEENLSKVNKYMRQASKCLDWIEKVIIDVMNMCTQDLNLATVMDKVYFRECHSTSDFMEEVDDCVDSDIMSMEINIDNQ